MQPAPGVDIDRATAVGQVVDTQGVEGWYPHEGSLMKYRVAIRFGQEPSTMPDGWNFGRVSSVATDSNNQVFVFHRGETADRIVEEMARGGGIITHADLASYAALWRDPVRARYRGYALLSMAPSSSGGY